jgi:hypothetical protein
MTKTRSTAPRRSRRVVRAPRRNPSSFTTQHTRYTNAFYQTWSRKAQGPATRLARYSANTTTITTSTSVEVNQSFYFTLDSVAGHTDFTSLYDQYRILAIYCELLPSNDGLTSGAIVVTPDYDDATAANVSTLLQYSAARRFPVGKPIYLTVQQPAVDLTVYGTSGAAPGVNRTSPWIDCGKADVQHYGLKLAVSPTGTSVAYQAMFKYLVEFRYVR